MTTATWALIIALVALALAVWALILANLAFRRSRPRRLLTPAALGQATLPQHPVTQDDAGTGGVWVIVNPAKVADMDALRTTVTTAALAAGWGQPRFLETSTADAGAGQACAAREGGAALVLIAGGDGTVRMACGELAGTQIPIGILPIGTGNLLARNLGIPVDSLTQACQIALTGRETALDLGWMRLDDNQYRHPFLVIAGVGFDADMMAGVSADWKSRIGWGAYVVSGVRALRSPSLNLTVRYADTPKAASVRARTLLFVSCGELTAGLRLVPGADPTDGWMEVTAIDVRGGLVGWAELGSHVIARAVGGRPRMAAVTSTMTMDRAREATVTVEGEPKRVQVDGDHIGNAQQLHVALDQHALVVRTI